jgi:hypothetical protein
MTHDADAVLSAAHILRELLRPIQERLDEQHVRLTLLEERPLGVIDGGVWEPGITYPKGTGTTCDGHFWVSQYETAEQPGEGNPSWRLAVSRGKQGREGKPGPPCKCAARVAS